MTPPSTAHLVARLGLLAAALPLLLCCNPKRGPEPLVPDKWKEKHYRLRYEASPHDPEERTPTQENRYTLTHYYPKPTGYNDYIICSLKNGWPVGRQRLWVYVIVYPPEAFEFGKNSIELRDSRDVVFEIGGPERKVIYGGWYLSFPVGPQHVVEAIPYDDPSYHLTLRVSYKYKGEAKELLIDKLDPRVEELIGM